MLFLFVKLTAHISYFHNQLRSSQIYYCDCGNIKKKAKSFTVNPITYVDQ